MTLIKANSLEYKTVTLINASLELKQKNIHEYQKY